MEEAVRRTREQFANSLCMLPQLTEEYGELSPFRQGYEEGQNSILLMGKKGSRRVVIKFDLPWNNFYRRAAFRREYELLTQLRGQKGIVQVLGELKSIELNVTSADIQLQWSEVISYYPMERARTDIATLIYSASGGRDILDMLIKFGSACRGVRKLHVNTICHRDLKPSNLLVFGPHEVKVGDLGCARRLGEGTQSILDVYSFPRGDVRYTAPELLTVARECDEGFLIGDIYSLGTILFEIATGRVYGDYVYSLEYLNEISLWFSLVPVSRRTDAFYAILPDIIRSHPAPNLSDLTGRIPPSISSRLEETYRLLTEPWPARRLSNFDGLFRQLEIMVRILRHERRGGSRF